MFGCFGTVWGGHGLNSDSLFVVSKRGARMETGTGSAETVPGASVFLVHVEDD